MYNYVYFYSIIILIISDSYCTML